MPYSLGYGSSVKFLDYGISAKNYNFTNHIIKRRVMYAGTGNWDHKRNWRILALPLSIFIEILLWILYQIMCSGIPSSTFFAMISRFYAQVNLTVFVKISWSWTLTELFCSSELVHVSQLENLISRCELFFRYITCIMEKKFVEETTNQLIILSELYVNENYDALLETWCSSCSLFYKHILHDAMHRKTIRTWKVKTLSCWHDLEWMLRSTTTRLCYFVARILRCQFQLSVMVSDQKWRRNQSAMHITTPYDPENLKSCLSGE